MCSREAKIKVHHPRLSPTLFRRVMQTGCLVLIISEIEGILQIREEMDPIHDKWLYSNVTAKCNLDFLYQIMNQEWYWSYLKIEKAKT